MGLDSQQTADSLVQGRVSEPVAWKKYLGAAAAILMAVPWLVAGLYKLTAVSQFQLMLTQILVPVSMSLPLAMAVIAGDLTAGILLLRPAWRRLGGILSTVLLTIFTIYFGVNYESLRGADCTCFPWIERTVGPEFFWSEAVMLALSVIAVWFAPPLKKIRGAGIAVACIAAVAVAALAVDKLGPQPDTDVPAVIAVGDEKLSLHDGKVFVFFFNPMCPHCLDAGITMSKYNWGADFVGVSTEEEDLAPGFIEDTGLRDVKLTPDLELLKEAFPFQDTPYAVAIENGQVKERFPFFEEPDLGERLRELGFVD